MHSCWLEGSELSLNFAWNRVVSFHLQQYVIDINTVRFVLGSSNSLYLQRKTRHVQGNWRTHNSRTLPPHIRSFYPRAINSTRVSRVENRPECQRRIWRLLLICIQCVTTNSSDFLCRYPKGSDNINTWFDMQCLSSQLCSTYLH